MNTPRDYHIKSVKDTTFDPDNYGNKYYSIEVEEQQGTILWKTKNRPEAGTVVYGHTEMSQSGKSMLFKKDQKEEGGSYPAAKPFAKSSEGETNTNQQDNIRWGLCIKEANAYVIAYRPDLDAEGWAKEVNEYANELYKVTTEPAKSPVDKVKELLGDNIPDDDIDSEPSKADYDSIPF